jgi:hypothetical protein
VRWHAFDPDTFEIGRTLLLLDAETSIGLYDPMRCIIDAFRLAHQLGPEVGVTALKRWLSMREGTPGELLNRALEFPAAYPALQRTVEILL